MLETFTSPSERCVALVRSRSQLRALLKTGTGLWDVLVWSLLRLRVGLTFFEILGRIWPRKSFLVFVSNGWMVTGSVDVVVYYHEPTVR